jgi:hypothetical protein
MRRYAKPGPRFGHPTDQGNPPRSAASEATTPPTTCATDNPSKNPTNIPSPPPAASSASTVTAFLAGKRREGASLTSVSFDRRTARLAPSTR